LTRSQNDFYPTPVSIIDAVMANLRWDLGRVWEPCAGDGRLVDALAANGACVVASDIVDGDDFFACAHAEADTLITNPPFRRLRQFIDHAFTIGVRRMALVCPERLWACGKGADQWRRHRPTRFVNLDWREDYLNKGGSPDRALAVSIWDAPHSEDCAFEIWSRARGSLDSD
tara:strand:- start:20 stop:535 length:516 start_codon:yes stop_codon:yes gene_type:complete